MKELFWRAASTYNVNAFHYWMKKIEEADPKLTPNQKTVADWLRKTDARLWARSHFSTNSKCDVLVNNFTESFNTYILQARDLPIISRFEWIRKKLMERIQVKKAGMERYTGQTCPNIVDKLESIKVESRVCVARWCGEREFEVDHFDRCNIVHLGNRSCSYRKWDMTGIPCCHGITAIQKDRSRIEDYVHPYYTRDGYLVAYSYMIHPVPDIYEYVQTGFFYHLIHPLQRNWGVDLKKQGRSKQMSHLPRRKEMSR